MHIGMIAYTEYYRDSRVKREAEALTARGDEVDFLCLKSDNCARTRFLSGVRLLHLNIGQYRGAHRGMYVFSYVRFFFCATFRIALEHLRNRYDIVHVHTMPDFLVFSAIIPKILGAKVVLDVHDLTPELYASKFRAGHKLSVMKFLTFVERCSIAFANKAIAVHQPHLNVLVRHGNPPDKFFILLNTPDQKIFKKASPAVHQRDGRFRMVYHGTISQRHGLEVALRAVAIVRRKIPALSFDIFGGGENLPCLKELAHELHLEDVVKFSGGFIALEKLCAEIRDADLGLIPILKDDFTQYMLPVKLLEYVFLGIPCATSRTATIESYFDDSMVRYVDSGDAESLADAIYDLFRHPDKRRVLAENADRFNKEFSWEKQKALFLEFVDNVAGFGVKGSTAKTRKSTAERRNR